MTKLFLTFLLAGMIGSATPLVEVSLVGAGTPPKSDGKHYVGPYTLRISGHEAMVLCIDLNDESSVGDHWLAYENDLAGSLQETYHPAWLRQYEEEAYLYSAISKPGADRIGIQQAAWAITDPGYQVDAAAKVWMERAAQSAYSIDLAEYRIISEAGDEAGPRKQEFITAVPEPSLIDLLGGMQVIGIGLLFRRLRRKRKGKQG